MSDELKNKPATKAIDRRNLLLGTSSLVATAALSSDALAQPHRATRTQAQNSAATTSAGGKPNILVIFGDDIGQTNISAYAFGVMGYKTPNIDRIAKEGVMFTDYYAENSCTAGRSSFITGQTPKRTGLSKVGIPGATVGLQDRDITIAQALKPLGYATGQFGKNHLGDRDKYLPTAHGFDEFFAFRYRNVKAVFCEMPYRGGFQVWTYPFVCLRVPKVFDLRMDPYERADVVSDQYYDWTTRRSYLIMQCMMRAGEFLKTFIEYPPSQEQQSFSIDQIQRNVEEKIKAMAAKPGAR
jgi:hypothetical protein